MFTNQIKDILEKQNKMCKCLIDLSLKIRIAAEKNDINKIDQLIKLEDALTMKFLAVEKHRINIVETYKKEKGYSSNDLCLLEISKFLNKNEADILKKVGNELKNNILELTRVNEINKKILKSRLDWVEFSLSVLSREEDNMYNIDNKMMNKEDRLINELI